MSKMPGLERAGSAVFGLVALNGALAAAVLAVALWPVSDQMTGSGLASASSSVAPTTQSSFSAPQSPLFARSFIAPASQTPKPAPPAASGAPSPSTVEARPLQWRVTGIIIAEEAAPLALIERKGQAAETRRVTVGAEVEDWLVEAILPRSVAFRRGSASVIATLDPAP
jgi:hypothetical protein